METIMIVFSEIQRQTQKWIYFLIVILLLVLIFGLIQQLVFGKPFGNPSVRNWVLPLFLIIPLGLFIFLRMNVLETGISKKGIEYRFKPYHSQTRLIQWNEIDKCYVRVYSPVREFGGWGVRFSIRDGGKALNVKGNYGIQLELKNGQKLLIGTQKPGEAKRVLLSLNINEDGTV